MGSVLAVGNGRGRETVNGGEVGWGDNADDDDDALSCVECEDCWG